MAIFFGHGRFNGVQALSDTDSPSLVAVTDTDDSNASDDYIEYGEDGGVVLDKQITKEDFLSYFINMTGNSLENAEPYWANMIK